MKKRSVIHIVADLTNYFITKNTGITTHDITPNSKQILFNSYRGKTSDTFPEDLFETDRFRQLVRLLQLLLNRWKQINTKFSIFISKGRWDKIYSIHNATSEVKTYGALNDDELNSYEKTHNYGNIMTNNRW